jgi:hypothetical protein
MQIYTGLGIDILRPVYHGVLLLVHRALGRFQVGGHNYVLVGWESIRDANQGLPTTPFI